jgi:acetyl esterase/lipase
MDDLSAHRRPCGPVALAALGLGIAAATSVIRRRRGPVAAVAPELRNPVLYLPVGVANERALRAARRFLARSTPVVEGVTVHQVHVPNQSGPPVPVSWYQRDDRRRPSGALLWIHGGGLVMGAPPQSHAWCSRVAAELDVLVANVDYRLAPEHPFPAGLDDCIAALAWLAANAEELGIDPDRIAVGGDSAGGGLAAAVAQRVRDEGGPALCFQLLVYPMLDDRTVVRSQRERLDALIWNAASNRFAWTAYLGHPPSEAPERPYAAPARTEDLRGLPPAWIGVGDIDLFHDEDVAYAHRLREAAVACELHIEPGMYHGADAVMPDRAITAGFRTRMIDALRPVLTGATEPVEADG